MILALMWSQSGVIIELKIGGFFGGFSTPSIHIFFYDKTRRKWPSLLPHLNMLHKGAKYFLNLPQSGVFIEED